MRSRIILAIVAVLVAVPTVPVAHAAVDDVPQVLVWSGTYGFRHPSITQAQLTFQQLALTTGAFDVTLTENPLDLSAATLADVDVLVWVNSTGKPPFTAEQREDIIRFAGCGGGTMAFHAAADSNYGWPEFAELIGAQFDSHPQGAGAGEVRMFVEDRTHPIMEGWSDVDEFMFDDEYYRWRAALGLDGISNPRNLDDVHVLLSMDETTVADGIQDGPLAYEEHQPIGWTKTFRNAGRVYYNNLGHSDSTWQLPEFQTSLVNGIDWVTDVQLDEDCFAGDTPLPAPAGPPAPDPTLVGRPCPVPAIDDRSGGTWQTSGAARTLTESGDEMVSPAAGIPGNLAWGAQFYVLDLSASGAATADVTVELDIPVPTDDYDLSVTTSWGWYGSQAAPGASTESLVITGAPHCALLQVYGDNLAATSGSAPTWRLTVAPAAVDDTPDGGSATDADGDDRGALASTGSPLGPLPALLLVAAAGLVPFVRRRDVRTR